MPVTCPHCSTRYVLPKALLGPGGARVRCPRCREPFVVTAEGDAVPPVVKPAENGTAAATTLTATNGAPPVTTGPPALASSPAEEEAPVPASEPVHAGPPTILAPITPRTEPVGEIEKTRLVGGTEASAPTTTGAEAPTESSAAVAHEPATPLEVARAVLDELSTHSGEAIAKSRLEGRLFREFGPVIAEAFEFYRRQVGSGADAAPFRVALREKWGVDLDPAHPAGRIS